MIEFRKISWENFGECVKLQPKEDQRSFVATNLSSLAEAYVALTNNECIPMPYAIYHNDIMVGFIMLSYNYANEDNAESAYWVWRFMIDRNYQGRGYGKEAIKKAIELIRTFPKGEASMVLLSYEPDNLVAKALYRSVGFVETGDIEDGELVAKLTV